MSAPDSSPQPARVLMLVVGDEPVPPALAQGAEVFPLHEGNGREALERIFACTGPIAVWGPVIP